jgi:hypothetical protein
MLRNHLRLAIAVLSAAFLPPALTCAQSQDTSSQSVAEAARRAREAKKKESAKSKVLTEDDFGAKKAKPAEQTPAPSAQANPASQATSDTATSQTPAAAAPAQDADAEKKHKEEVAKLKQELAGEEQALDLDKREAALAQDSFYSNPGHDRDKAGKNRLDALQQQITDRQGKVQELKTRLAALESQKPSSPSTASSSTPPPAL